MLKTDTQHCQFALNTTIVSSSILYSMSLLKKSLKASTCSTLVHHSDWSHSLESVMYVLH
jgi:hypothetical protein